MSFSQQYKNQLQWQILKEPMHRWMKNKGDEPSRRMMTKKIKNVMFPNNPVNEAKPQQLPQPNPKKKKTCAFIDSRNFMDSNNRSSSRRASIFFGSHKATQIIRNKK